MNQRISHIKKETSIPPMVGVLIGISFYEISDTVLYLVEPLFYPTLLRIVGMVLTIYYLSKASYKRLDSGITTVFNFMIFWSVIMLLRGSFMGNYIPGGPYGGVDLVRRAFMNSFGALTFFIPLMALMQMKWNSLYYIKRFAIVYCAISLIMTYMAKEQIAYGQISEGWTTIQDVNGEFISVRTLIRSAFPGFGLTLFGLFCNNYIKGPISLLFPIAIFFFFIAMAIGGGRGDTIFNLLYLIAYFYLLIRWYPINKGQNGRRSKGSRITRRVAAIVLSLGFGVLLLYLYKQTDVFDYVLERAFGTKQLSTEIHSDSREILVRDFVQDFNAHPLDWIWGRGVNGSYVTHHLDINGRRAWMEWGYLYLVLKGGVVYLVLFVLCMLHAVYLGFRKSRNAFSKCLSVMCLMLLFDLSSTNAEPQFTTQFVLTWFCFGMLERKEVLMMSDDDICDYFDVKNHKRIEDK